MHYRTIFCATTSAIALFASAAAHAQDGGASPVDSDTPASADEAVDEGIVVTGLRRSLETAASIKRSSEGIVDAIVAEDIGKLPDTFASSALARVTGVTVTRGAGEAAGVTVRGLPNITTTYNGREIFTAEGRFVQIQDFPAGTVAALEVYKSSTANMIEGGIGGAVNVRGRKPFDFAGFHLSGMVNGVNWEQSGQLTWNGNLLVSDRFDTGIGEMGLLVNVSYNQIKFLDSIREQSLVIGTTNPGTAPGTTGGVRYPDAQAMFMGYGDRSRPSVNAAFQWRPTPELEIYADGLWQGVRGEELNRFMFVPIFGGGLQLTNLTTLAGSPNVAQSATVTGANAPDGFWSTIDSHTDTYQGGAGAIWKRDNLEISADVAYTDSTYMLNAVNIDYAFASSPARNVVFEAPGDVGGPSFNFINFDVTDAANYISRGLYQERLVVRGKDIQARTDLRYSFDDGFLKRIDVGLRFNDRDANRDRGAPYIWNLPSRIPITALPVDLASGMPGFKFDDVLPIHNFVYTPYDSVRANVADLRQFFGAPAGLPAFNPTENFVANEKAFSAYAQIKYGFELGNSMVLDGLIGLRAIKTKTRISGFIRDETNPAAPVFVPTTAENEYTDYLPNVSARLALTPELQLRAAYTQTRTRPNFFSLNPTLTVGPPVNNPNPADPNSNRRNINGGNPNLQPLMSDNYDLSLEWYFSRAGSLTGAIFRRDARGFISNTTIFVDDPVYGPARLTRPENTNRTRFQGAEIGFTSFLDFDGLPEWARSFGIQANGTYIDSKGDLNATLNASPNVNGQQLPFNGVSKWAFNLVGIYERPFFSARLAYNYRSDFVSFYSRELFDVDSNGAQRTGALIEEARGQLDFSASVTPTPNVTVAFDVGNVLGNPVRRHREFNDAGDAFTRQYVYLERTYSVGVRFRF